MGNEPKSNDNPLAEVAKAIGSSLGNAANRASELLRAATTGNLLSKPRTSQKRKSAVAAKAKGKAQSKKKSSSTKTKAPASKPTGKARKSASRNKVK